MKLALINSNVVLNVITSACPDPQNYQAIIDVSSVYCEPGWTWNGGTSFTKVIPPDVANEKTLRDQALTAIDVNKTAIATANSWLAANTGTLTAAQLSNAMRSVMQQQVTAAQQRNGIIRVLLGKFDGTD